MKILHSVSKLLLNLTLPFNPIKEHFCNHIPDLENFSVLATNNNEFKVTLMETLLMNKDHPL